MKVQADLDAKPKDPKLGHDLPNNALELFNTLKRYIQVLQQRCESAEIEETRLHKRIDKQGKNDTLVYNKNREAVKQLGRKPEIFERPTVILSAVDHIDG